MREDLVVAAPTQGNIATTYENLGRLDEGLRLRQDVYSGTIKLLGEEHRETLSEANNYAVSLKDLSRFEETKSLLRKTIPIARRVLSENHKTTLTMRTVYAEALFYDSGATLDDLREAVATLEDTERTARRVLGGAHPTAKQIENALLHALAALRARRNVELRAAFKEDPSSLSAEDRARAEQLLARDARKATKKKAPPPPRR